MNFEMAQLQALIAGLLWPLARVSGLMLTAPVLGAQTPQSRMHLQHHLGALTREAVRVLRREEDGREAVVVALVSG